MCSREPTESRIDTFVTENEHNLFSPCFVSCPCAYQCGRNDLSLVSRYSWWALAFIQMVRLYSMLWGLGTEVAFSSLEVFHRSPAPPDL
jgi:hypothetical protein